MPKSFGGELALSFASLGDDADPRRLGATRCSADHAWLCWYHFPISYGPCSGSTPPPPRFILRGNPWSDAAADPGMALSLSLYETLPELAHLRRFSQESTVLHTGVAFGPDARRAADEALRMFQPQMSIYVPDYQPDLAGDAAQTQGFQRWAAAQIGPYDARCALAGSAQEQEYGLALLEGDARLMRQADTIVQCSPVSSGINLREELAKLGQTSLLAIQAFANQRQGLEWNAGM